MKDIDNEYRIDHKNGDIPLVTVVTPVYNHSKFLELYIESLLSQNYTNIELIIIDDCSTDNSVDIIKKKEKTILKKVSKYIFIENQTNKGVSENCNIGLKYATGKYICFFASDDIMLKNRLASSVEFLEKNGNFMMSYSGAHLKIDGKTKIYKPKKQPEGNIFFELLSKGNFIIAASVTMNRKVFNKAGMFNPTLLAEDYDMWLKISSKYQIGFINDALSIYRIHTNSLSNTRKYKRDIFFQYKAIKEEIMKKNKVPDYIVKKVLIRDSFNSMKSYFYYNLKNEFKQEHINWKKIKKRPVVKRLAAFTYKVIISIGILYRIIIYLALYMKYGNTDMYKEIMICERIA